MPSTVRVCIRTRPTSKFAGHAIAVADDKSTISLSMPKADNPNATDSWSWKFDSVLHNASQETVYGEQVAPIVRSVLQGYNGAVMCYGQTGAGKTFTQLGSTDNYHNRGLVPRAIADIFAYVAEHPQFEATVHVSYLEIHNDTLVDLLGSLPSEEKRAEELSLYEDREGATHVKGLRKVPVGSEEEALGMLFEGQNNRAVANHTLNRNSTRGHSMFTMHVQARRCSRVLATARSALCVGSMPRRPLAALGPAPPPPSPLSTQPPLRLPTPSSPPALHPCPLPVGLRSNLASSRRAPCTAPSCTSSTSRGRSGSRRRTLRASSAPSPCTSTARSPT